MKAWIIVPFVLLAGLAIGGWGAKTDLAAAKKEVESLREELAKHGRRTGGLNNVTRMLGVDTKAARGGAKRPRATDTPSNTNTASTASAATTSSNTASIAEPTVTQPNTEEDRPRRRRHRERDLEKQLEEAYALWETRSSMARATFLDNLRLSDADSAQFDVLMEAMNVRLADSLGRLADDLREGGEMGPEKGIRIANEVTGAFVQTYNEMDRTMPETWRENAGKEFKLFDFVDPYVASPLIGVEDKLGNGFMGGM
jgi:hypothetical protein